MSLWRVASLDEEPEIVLALWRVFQTDLGTNHFVGWRAVSGSGRVSTAIVEFDPKAGLGKTESGRAYRLAGEPSFSSDALATWQGWVLVNGVTSTADISEEVFASMLFAGFDPNGLAESGSGSPDQPEWPLTNLPEDFPTFNAPRRWGFNNHQLLPGSAAMQLYFAKFCERQAQEVAAEYRDDVTHASQQEEILTLLYDSWKSGLFINEAERIWVVKRTASLLGWDCPQSIFEIKSETNGKQ